MNRSSSRKRVSPTNRAAALLVGVPAGPKAEGVLVVVVVEEEEEEEEEDSERCIQRFAHNVASTPLFLSGQLGTNPFTAMIVSVKCDGRSESR